MSPASLAFLLTLRHASRVMSRADESRGYYDHVHYSSERVPESIPGKLALSDPWYQLILEFLARNQIEVRGRRVLEVGCGLGGLCLTLAADGAVVTGVDISSSAIRSASRLVPKREPEGPGVRYALGDAKRLPFADKSFDVVVCAETLEHTFAVEASLRELWRVCADSGYVAITVPNSTVALPMGLLVHALHLDQPQVLLSYFRLRRLVRQVGFRPVDEFGTNFFRDMILNDVLPEAGRRLARRVSELAGKRMRRSSFLWTVTAGTLGFLLQKELPHADPSSRRVTHVA
jgi:ubiquinone/menaquinone biosynthesis C-methylase UbiE